MNDAIVETPRRATRETGAKRRDVRLKVLVGVALPVLLPVVMAGQAWANGCCCG